MTFRSAAAAVSSAIVLALAASALPASAAPGPAGQPRALTAPERMGLRCAAAFAVVAAGQARGEAAMKAYPPMVPRGREFFVRMAAQLMDSAGLDEAGIRAAAEVQARAMQAEGGVATVMPSCLKVLEAQPGL